MRERIKALMRKIESMDEEDVHNLKEERLSSGFIFYIEPHDNYPKQTAIFARFAMFRHNYEVMYGVFGEGERRYSGKPVITIRVSHGIIDDSYIYPRTNLLVTMIDDDIDIMAIICDKNTEILLKNNLAVIEGYIDDVIEGREMEYKKKK